MSSTRNAARGFTLVEVMVSSVMAALFFTMLYGMFLPVLSVSSASGRCGETTTGADFSLARDNTDLVRDLSFRCIADTESCVRAYPKHLGLIVSMFQCAATGAAGKISSLIVTV